MEQNNGVTRFWFESWHSGKFETQTKYLFNQTSYEYFMKFTKTINIITIYSWYMMDFGLAGRPLLWPYITVSIGTTRRGRECTCSEIMQLSVDGVRLPGLPLRHPMRDSRTHLTSANEIYGCPIRKWITVTRPNYGIYSSNCRRVDTPHWMIAIALYQFNHPLSAFINMNKLRLWCATPVTPM